MTQRIAASLGLLAFATCVMAGLYAGNGFSTTVLRALAAMTGMYVIGLVLGSMGQRMIDEHVQVEEEKLRKSTKLEMDDR